MLKAPDPLAALALPLGNGECALPEGDGVFLNADHQADLAEIVRSRVTCEQPFRPAFERLESAGWRVAPRVDGSFAFAIVLLGKHAEENRLNLARAYRMLSAGGLFVLAGSNEIGAARWERAILPWLAAPESRFKHKSRIAWGRKPESGEPAEIASWIALDGAQPILDGRYSSSIGLFGWNKIDPGSALLVEHLPEGIAGRVADLGAGWGFLSDYLLRHYPAIRSLDVIEADARGIAAAERNLAPIEGQAERGFRWIDATKGLPEQYDWILCNPPFHDGKEAKPELGQAILAAAGPALVPGGTLMVVANRLLPYEEKLTAALGEVERLVDRDGFKVLRIVRRSASSRNR